MGIPLAKVGILAFRANKVRQEIGRIAYRRLKVAETHGFSVPKPWFQLTDSEQSLFEGFEEYEEFIFNFERSMEQFPQGFPPKVFSYEEKPEYYRCHSRRYAVPRIGFLIDYVPPGWETDEGRGIDLGVIWP